MFIVFIAWSYSHLQNQNKILHYLFRKYFNFS